MENSSNNTASKLRFMEYFNIFKKKPTSLKDLHSVLSEANESHLIDPDAYRMMEGVLNVSHLSVHDFMVPRSQMVVFDLGSKISEILPTLIESGHSRFPVIGEDKDNIVGILLAKDLLSHLNSPQKETLVLDKAMLRTPRFVPESKHLDALLKEFKARREHIALVMDEYGGISGLITIEDVLEQIVGDIEDEFDDEEQFVSLLGENAYLLQAITPLEAFNDFFKTSLSSDKVDTIGGLVIEHLQHIPLKDEKLWLPPFEFTVKEADTRRVLQLQVRVMPAS